MASEQAKELRKQGIAAAKAGQKEQARALLMQSLRLDPGSEAAWTWLANVAKDQREKLVCLQRVLEINPGNTIAQKALQQLGISREELARQVGGKATAPAVSTAARGEPPPQAPGVPLPDPQKIAQAQSQAEAIVREYLLPPEGYPDIQWVQKSGRRAGERDIVYLRMMVGGGIAAALVILLIIGAVVVTNTPELRAVVFAPTRTPTRTPQPPTLTYTPTAGVTPTPSPTPELTLTPSPTVPPQIQNNALEPTEIYPLVIEKTIRDAVALIDSGQYEAAIPTLVVEVTRVATRFDPRPYYYQALALARDGQLDAAALVLADAERRLPETPNENYRPLIDSGLAYVELLQAQQEMADGDRSAASTLLANVEDRAEAAIEGDPRLELAYITLARRHRFFNNYDLALGVLDQGLSVPELRSSTNLIVEKGDIYFEQGEYDLAAYQAFVALYINPTTEPAHLLQIWAALAQDKPGLAVLHTQAYLFYYPGSVLGYKLLGDARIAEGNFDLALEAYSQALAGGQNTPEAADILVARAQLYSRQGRYEQARDDLTAAFNLTRDPAVQAQRMIAAYNAGNTATAERDAEELLGEGVISDDEIRLLQARIRVDEADGEADYQAALDLLDSVGSLPPELQPVADEYRARAQYHLEAYTEALTQVNRALAAEETGSRYYLRGLILEAQGDTEAALRDYDWVLTLSAIYPYPFLPDVRERAEALRQE